jgi:hypothetical protein
MKLLPLLLACLAFAACSTTATLIPITGPLATRRAPEIHAMVRGVWGYDGELTFTMPDGEQVTGRWQCVRTGHGTTTKGAGTARGNRGSIFDFEFDADSSVHGIGKATDNKGNTYRILVHGVGSN